MTGGRAFDRAANRWRPVWVTASVLAGVLLGFASWLPPASDGTTGSATGFSVERARATIETIATEPHPMGSEAIAAVRAEIIERLRSLGLAVETQTMVAPDYFGRPGATVEVVNVIAHIPGADSTRAVAMIAHYDTDPQTPGANDDSSGVAIVLESARALIDGPPLRNDVVLLFTDGEEPGPRFGASGFVDHPWFADLAFVVNLETIGSAGPSLVIDAGGPESWVTEVVAEAMPHPVASSLLPAVNRLTGGSNTDFAVFRDAGIAGLDLAYFHDSTIYHTERDIPATVSDASLRRQGENALDVIRHVADLDLTTPPTGTDTTFLTIGRSLVVGYPSWLDVVVGAIGLALAIGLGLSAGPASVGRAAGRALASLFLAILVGSLLWIAVAGNVESLPLTAGALAFVCLAVLSVAISVPLVVRGRASTFETAVAMTLIWAVMGALGLVDRGIGHLFVWPAVSAIAAVWLIRWRRAPGWSGSAAAGLSIAVTVALALPAAEIFFEFAYPRPGNPDSQVLPVAGVSAMLLAMTGMLAATLVRLDSERATDAFAGPTSKAELPVDAGAIG